MTLNWSLVLEILPTRVREQCEFRPGKSSWGAESQNPNQTWNEIMRTEQVLLKVCWCVIRAAQLLSFLLVCQICEKCFPQHPTPRVNGQLHFSTAWIISLWREFVQVDSSYSFRLPLELVVKEKDCFQQICCKG